MWAKIQLLKLKRERERKKVWDRIWWVRLKRWRQMGVWKYEMNEFVRESAFLSPMQIPYTQIMLCKPWGNNRMVVHLNLCVFVYAGVCLHQGKCDTVHCNNLMPFSMDIADLKLLRSFTHSKRCRGTSTTQYVVYSPSPQFPPFVWSSAFVWKKFIQWVCNIIKSQCRMEKRCIQEHNKGQL